MSLVEKMIGAAKLDVSVYESVEADQTATGQAMTVVALAAVAGAIGAYSQGVMAAVLSLIGALLGWVIWAFLAWLVGTKMLPEPQTDADIGQLLRTLGFAQAPGVLRIFGIIPVIGVLINFVVAIWVLVASFIAVRQALDYQSNLRTFAVVVIGFLAWMFFAVVLGLIAGVGAAAVGAMGGA